MKKMKNSDIKLTPEQIKQLREKELELLKMFVVICNQLQLNYFIVQGTLLGAVRHQGFIPWDDDIDVGMLRKDYEIFLEKASEYIPENYFLQTYETDPEYTHCFAKLRNSQTTFIETTCKNRKMNHGIYIDIFPFDYYPDGKLRGILFDLKKLIIRYRIREVYYIPSDEAVSMINIIRKILKLLSKCCYKTVEDALKKQQQLYTGIKKSKYLINNGSPWGNRERIPSEWMEEYTEMDFEGLSVKAPARYREYLQRVYGDYMTLPPAQKRVPHHYISAIDFEKSYCEYTENNTS